MVENVIYGQQDAYSTKCAPSILPSRQKTSLASTEKLLLEIMTQFLQLTRHNSLTLSACV